MGWVRGTARYLDTRVLQVHAAVLKYQDLGTSEHMSCSPDTGTVGYTQYLGAVTLHVDLSGRYLQGLA